LDTGWDLYRDREQNRPHNSDKERYGNNGRYYNAEHYELLI